MQTYLDQLVEKLIICRRLGHFEDLIQKIDPEIVSNYFLSEKALKGPHKELALKLQQKSTFEQIGQSFTKQYQELPPNYVSKKTLLKVGSEVFINKIANSGLILQRVLLEPKLLKRSVLHLVVLIEQKDNRIT